MKFQDKLCMSIFLGKYEKKKKKKIKMSSAVIFTQHAKRELSEMHLR